VPDGVWKGIQILQELSSTYLIQHSICYLI
jgi:hypothetical protein